MVYLANLAVFILLLAVWSGSSWLNISLKILFTVLILVNAVAAYRWADAQNLLNWSTSWL